jgi:anti-sigma regulatory factor (Ser/Thr protein kinase)
VTAGPGGGKGQKAGPKATLEIRFPSDTAYLGLVREISRRMCETLGFDDATAVRIALAVDEATTNVMEHAYHGARDQEVEVRFADGDEALEVLILDTGSTVDRASVPDVDAELLRAYARERRTGGLGMHLIEKIMDSVSYERLARRNVCHLVKRKPREKA